MNEPVLSMAFLTGLLGSGHCIGMCGGLVAALTMTEQGQRGGLAFHILYHAGRVLTYMLIGGLVGWLGSLLPLKDSLGQLTRALLIGSDLLVIVLGLGTAGAFARLNLNRLDFPGPTAAMARALNGLRRWPPAFSALPLGLLMGWLPCGFVYAMLITAGQSGTGIAGAGIMLAFGIGTTPALLIFGSAAGWLTARARSWMVRGAGLAVAGIGVMHLLKHLRMPH
ncbi:hypothetical protein EDC39_105139 [Geothermobacter ehrlichii]|uniref:Rhodanese domain-containing protein n=1 Tax=Geothermobacter ehrlichii TaxID=213224 RepID=A0A5D3WKY6_9BACT|nr:sulfite exporter TauE/SafE family protein [Geothermobacter ehrlichii]TYO98770.1 hypothetical protein EDC39_105139 [Geothermobacter ehrlichii]